MPSNVSIITAITEVCEGLGKGVPEIKGKNNRELADILSDLRAEEKEVSKELKTDDSTEEKEVSKEPFFHVKKGKAITSKRGIISDGDEIRSSDLPGGEEALRGFVTSGHVVKG